MNKTYRRILAYAPNLTPRMVQFFCLCTVGRNLSGNLSRADDADDEGSLPEGR